MSTSTGRLSDGTTITVDGPGTGPPDPTLPLVILVHGMGGSILDMTAPAAAWPGLSFNRSVFFPLYKDEGLRPVPPAMPIARLYLDPPAPPLTSWNAALKSAGFTTLTYTQASPSGLIAPNIMQLNGIVTEALIGTVQGLPDLTSLRVAFVGHSRGGLIVRSFLTGAAANPALAGFLSRVTTLITLHSPNAGSGVAGFAAAVATLLARLGTAFTVAGLPTGAALATTLGGFVLSPGTAELVPGSATLAAIAAAEPVAGIIYHTFGGISTDFARLWADVYTPDSNIPFFLPFVPIPIFHWGSSAVVVGVPLNVASFIPAVLAAPTPVVTEIVAVLTGLAATVPDLAPGLGDLLVSDANARLPFSTSHTSNFLNHLEALSDPALQAQVVAILARLARPTSSGVATVSLDPFPARPHTSTQYRVTAKDSVTGMALTQGTVQVFSNSGHLDLTAQLGAPFTYNFTGHQVHIVTFDPVTHRRETETDTAWPIVFVDLGPPFGRVAVNTGL